MVYRRILQLNTTFWLQIRQFNMQKRSIKAGTSWNRQLLLSSKRREQFLGRLPNMVDELFDDQNVQVLALKNRSRELINYMMPYGKMFRSFLMISTYELLEEKENLTPENQKLADNMGWLLEFFQSVFLLIDDSIDDGEIRRGKPCWHRKVGNMAIHDTFLLAQWAYGILDKYFSNHPCYVPTLQILHKILFKSLAGELSDIIITKGAKPKIDMFQMETYKTTAILKTGLSTFNTPITIGMYLAKIFDEGIHNKLSGIYEKLGVYYQVQDDYIDCFGTSSKAGKKFKDIQDGKCTWLAVMATELSNSIQKDIIKEYYGSSHPESRNIIINLFKELELPELYNSYIIQSKKELQEEIDSLDAIPKLQELLHNIVNSLDKREC